MPELREHAFAVRSTYCERKKKIKQEQIHNLVIWSGLLIPYVHSYRAVRHILGNKIQHLTD